MKNKENLISELAINIERASAIISEIKACCSDQKYKIERIGGIEHGINGSDEYALVTSLDNDIDISNVELYMLHKHYNKGFGQGSYYCHNISIINMPSNNQAIAIIHHRYNV